MSSIALYPPSVMPYFDLNLKDIRDALREDHYFEKMYNDSLQLLLRKSNDKKREDQEFFDKLGYSVMLEEFQKLKARQFALEQKLEQARTDEELAEKALAEKELQKQYAETAAQSDAVLPKNTSSVEIKEIKAEIEKHKHKIVKLDIKIEELHFELELNKSMSTKAAENIAKGITAYLEMILELDKVKAEAEASQNTQQIEGIQALEEKVKETITSIQAKAKAVFDSGETPEMMFKHVTPYKAEFDAQKAKLMSANMDECTAEKQAMKKVLDNPYQVRAQILTASDGKKDCIELKNAALKLDLPESLKKKIQEWQSIRMITQMLAREECRNAFQTYSQKIFSAHETSSQLGLAIQERNKVQSELVDALCKLDDLYKMSPKTPVNKSASSPFQTELRPQGA